MIRYLRVTALAGLIFLHAGPAAASSPEFGYVYTAETEEAGETELSLWATDRRGKGAGHYDAQDYRLEVERGITDRFQIAAYANFASHHIRGLDGEPEKIERDFAFQGLSAEFKYQLLDPKTKPVGLAFYVEPAWSRISKVKGEKAREVELEFKVIAQKNFMDNRLVWATNLTVEPEWEREREEVAPGLTDVHTEKELAFEASTGLSYRIGSKWWLGFEGRYHSVYPDWTHGFHRENYAIYAGPTVHFSAGEWAVTAAWLPQLTGSPSPRGSLEYDDHEKRELRLKISREF